MTITEQLDKVIEKLETDINETNGSEFFTLIFRFKKGRFKKFEKTYSKSDEEIGIEITD